MERILLTLSLICSATAFTFSQSKALFTIEQNGKAGYMNDTGKIVIKPVFDEGWGFSEGLAPVKIGDVWGYINETGKVVIKPQFLRATDFHEGIAKVSVFFEKRATVNGRGGYDSYIDKSGKLITDEQFGVAFRFSEGLAQVLTRDYKHALIDRTGTIKFYFDIYNAGFADGLAMFKTRGNMPDSRIGYIDKTGKVAIEPIFLSGEDFSEDLACARSDKGAGFIDKTGKFVIEPQFTFCEGFSDGLAAVNIEGLWGYIDKTGKMVIQPQFAEASLFSEGTAVVQTFRAGSLPEKLIKQGGIITTKYGLFGIIDRQGAFIIPPKYTQMNNFRDGLAWVNLSDEYVVHGNVNRWGYINRSGKLVWKTK